jgi:hypothetical protein
LAGEDAGGAAGELIVSQHPDLIPPGYTGSMAVTPAQVIHLAECFEAVFDGLGGNIADAVKKLDEERKGGLS